MVGFKELQLVKISTHENEDYRSIINMLVGFEKLLSTQYA